MLDSLFNLLKSVSIVKIFPFFRQAKKNFVRLVSNHLYFFEVLKCAYILWFNRRQLFLIVFLSATIFFVVYGGDSGIKIKKTRVYSDREKKLLLDVPYNDKFYLLSEADEKKKDSLVFDFVKIFGKWLLSIFFFGALYQIDDEFYDFYFSSYLLYYGFNITNLIIVVLVWYYIHTFVLVVSYIFYWHFSEIKFSELCAFETEVSINTIKKQSEVFLDALERFRESVTFNSKKLSAKRFDELKRAYFDFTWLINRSYYSYLWSATCFDKIMFFFYIFFANLITFLPFYYSLQEGCWAHITNYFGTVVLIALHLQFVLYESYESERCLFRWKLLHWLNVEKRYFYDIKLSMAFYDGDYSDLYYEKETVSRFFEKNILVVVKDNSFYCPITNHGRGWQRGCVKEHVSA